VIITEPWIRSWVSGQLFGDCAQFDEKCTAIGVMENGKLLAGVVYSDYRPNLSIEMNIASVDKRWCSRHNLKIFFQYTFTQLNLGRAQATCSVMNEGAISMLLRLGFKQEGYHPQARYDGDALSFGMLKHNCKWI